MIVKRRQNADGEILIELRSLNPNYASAARLSGAALSPGRISAAASGQQHCSGGLCQWSIRNCQHKLILSAAADLIPGAQEGDVNFEVSIFQNSELIPPFGNSYNPATKKATGFQGDRSIKTAIFSITIL